MPTIYPNLHVAAVDAREFSSLYTRYAVVGTPTVFLWHNRALVARYGDEYSFVHLTRFLQRWTDLSQRRNVSREQIGNASLGPLPTAAVKEHDYLLYVAIVYATLISVWTLSKVTTTSVIRPICRHPSCCTRSASCSGGGARRMRP